MRSRLSTKEGLPGTTPFVTAFLLLVACGAPAGRQNPAVKESHLASLISNLSSNDGSTQLPYSLKVEGNQLVATAFCLRKQDESTKSSWAYCQQDRERMSFSSFSEAMKGLLLKKIGPIEPLEAKLQASFTEAAKLDEQLVELSSSDPSATRVQAGELFRDFSARIASVERSLQELSTQIARIESDLQSRMDPDLRTQLASLYAEKQAATQRSNALRLELSQRRNDLLSAFSGVQPAFFSELRRKRATLRSTIEKQSADLESYMQKWSDLNQILSIVASQRLDMEFKNGDGFFKEYESILRLIPKALDLAIEDSFEAVGQIPLEKTRETYKSFSEDREFTLRKLAQDLMRLHPQLRSSGCVVDKGKALEWVMFKSTPTVKLKCDPLPRHKPHYVSEVILYRFDCVEHGLCLSNKSWYRHGDLLARVNLRHRQTKVRDRFILDDVWRSTCQFALWRQPYPWMGVVTPAGLKCDFVGLP